MNFVIDASIVAAWMLGDEQSDVADRVIDSLVHNTAIAPSFLSLEVSNILLLAEKRHRISAGARKKLTTVFKNFGIVPEHYSQEYIFSHVLPMASFHRLSAYDAVYLELASRLLLPLATVGKKLRAAAKKQGVSLFDGDNGK